MAHIPAALLGLGKLSSEACDVTLTTDPRVSVPRRLAQRRDGRAHIV